MSDEQPPMVEQKKVAIKTPNGEMKEVTQTELEKLFLKGAKVTKITVSYNRKLNTDNFESQDFFQGAEIDFSTDWSYIPDESLMDAEQANMIQRAFANASLQRIGITFRGMYVNALWCINDIAREKNLKWYPQIKAELANLNGPSSFDPFDTRGLRRKETQ